MEQRLATCNEVIHSLEREADQHKATTQAQLEASESQMISLERSLNTQIDSLAAALSEAKDENVQLDSQVRKLTLQLAETETQLELSGMAPTASGAKASSAVQAELLHLKADNADKESELLLLHTALEQATEHIEELTCKVQQLEDAQA